jgi:hypothetical protein
MKPFSRFLVMAQPYQPHNDFIPLGDQVFDFNTQIGIGAKKRRGIALGLHRSRRGIAGSIMIDIFTGEQFISNGYVSGIEQAFKVTANGLFVVFVAAGHISSV